MVTGKIKKSKVLVFAVSSMLIMLSGYLFVRFSKPVIVSGNSMYPTFSDNEIILFRAKEPMLGNLDGNPVCVVRLTDGKLVLKRLVGYPGDTVIIDDDLTIVNGQFLMHSKTENWEHYEFELNDNEFLFLGDNRDYSLDARHWNNPFVTLDDIVYVIDGTSLG